MAWHPGFDFLMLLAVTNGGDMDNERSTSGGVMGAGKSAVGDMHNAQSRELTLDELINELFTYHAPDAEQQKQYEVIRDCAKHFAIVIMKNVPHGADRTAAIRKLRECVMTANAGIALRGLSL
jgi:predicted ABC-type ATPase